MDRDKIINNNNALGEQARFVENVINPIGTPPGLSPTRTYTSPLMGTSARAAKRRNEGDIGLTRLDNTDIQNEQLQRHYQNIQQVLDIEQSNRILKTDQSRSLSNTRQDSFEPRIQRPSSSSTYDSPPAEYKPMQKVITTITTTTNTIPTLVNRNISSNQLSLTNGQSQEQIDQIQKSTDVKAVTNDSYQARTNEKHSVSANDPEVRRMISFPMMKTSGSTDLDKAQAELNNLNDDHQAIKQLSQALNQHNKAVINEYKRLPSQTNSGVINTTITTSTTKLDQINKPQSNEFTVIDALLENPLGSYDEKYNNTSHKRFNDIITNMKGSDSINMFTSSGEKGIANRTSKITTTTIVNTPLNNKQTPLMESNIGPTLNSSEQTPLLNAKEKKKQDKENKKKSKNKSKNLNYQVIDALISNPTSSYLPDEYLAKYKIISPLSSIPCIASVSNAIQSAEPSNGKGKADTLHHLAKVVKELMLHHASVLTASTTVTKTEVQQPVKPTNSNQTISPQQQPVKPTNSNQTISPQQQQPVKPTNSNLIVSPQQQQQQKQVTNANLSAAQSQPEAVTPRIIYRYTDEQGNVLKLSSISPSQLQDSIPDQPKQSSYRYVEPSYTNTRQTVRDDERIYRRPEHEQRTGWQDNAKPTVTTTVTKDIPNLQGRTSLQNDGFIPEQPPRQYSYCKVEPTYIPIQQIIRDDENGYRRRDYETCTLRQDDPRPTPTIKREEFRQDQHQSQPHERPSSKIHTIPISVEYQDSTKTLPPEQQRTHHPNEENIALSWLPLYPEHTPSFYDVDPTMHEHVPNYRTYEYVPIHTHCPQNNRAISQHVIYHDYPSGHACYTCPTSVPYSNANPLSEHRCQGCLRNYIEVFRGNETVPSEVYSVPLSEALIRNHHHSYGDLYGERRENNHARPFSPQRHYEKKISSKSNHELHRPHTFSTSSHHDNVHTDNGLSQSKSFDYRPLRTKLLREHQPTSRLLVNESDNYPQNLPTGYYKQPSASSTREALSNQNQTKKA